MLLKPSPTTILTVLDTRRISYDEILRGVVKKKIPNLYPPFLMVGFFGGPLSLNGVPVVPTQFKYINFSPVFALSTRCVAHAVQYRNA